MGFHVIFNGALNCLWYSSAKQATTRNWGWLWRTIRKFYAPRRTQKIFTCLWKRFI